MDKSLYNYDTAVGNFKTYNTKKTQALARVLNGFYSIIWFVMDLEHGLIHIS